MSDRLVKDYGVVQVHHNGSHAYVTGEVHLLCYLDEGLSIDEGRREFADEWGDGHDGNGYGWGFENPELADFCRRWASETPRLGGSCAQRIYQRLKAKRRTR